MEKVFKSILATAVALMISTSASMAFGGFSIGVYGATGDFDTAGKENDVDAASERDTANTETTNSESVEFGGVFAEFTTADTGLGWTFGLEWIPHDAEIGAKTRTDSNDINTDDGTYSAKAEVENHLSAYIEPTWMFNDNMGLYLKGGVTKVTLNTLENLNIGADSSSYGNIDIYGGMYGAGFKAVTNFGIFFKLEGLKTEYETFKLNSTTSTSGARKSIEVTDIESEVARIAIGYNF